MSDTETEPIESWTPRRRTRRRITVCTLLGCGAIIFYVIGYGEPANTLHQSALSWAFTLAGATIGGYIFGATWDNANVLRSGR